MGLTNEQIEAKKQDIIDFADIGEHLYQPVKTYSSGMFARLAFACAINVDPDILIVDEVLSVGDMAFQLKCFKKFEEFKKNGKTILFVTHGVGDVLRNCTRVIILQNGRKIFDGDVKTGVDKYKKLMVGLDIDAENEIEDDTQINQEDDAEVWKSHFDFNEEQLSYGENKVDIYDYGIFDEKGEYAYSVNNTEEVSVKMKIRINEDIENPIFALTFKDIKGLEITGTNTMYYKILTGQFKKGERVIVEFKQRIPLAPGKYTLSFGCTKFNANGDLIVYQRRYDALFIEIISNRECVGFVDLNTKISFKKF